MDAFDADVLIYAAVPGHPLGEQVAELFRSAAPATVAGIGSVLLLPEVLARPLRDDATGEVRILAALLARLDLRPVDRATAELATALSSRYRLEAADATHLATAVGMGADRFITSNKRDFPPTITEVQVTYPDDLAGPADSDIGTVEGMLAELVRRGAAPVREVAAATASCRPSSPPCRARRSPGTHPSRCAGRDANARSASCAVTSPASNASSRSGGRADGLSALPRSASCLATSDSPYAPPRARSSCRTSWSSRPARPDRPRP